MDKSRRRTLILASGGIAAVAGGVGLQILLRGQGADAAAIADLWAYPLQNLEGDAAPLSRWKGRILVVNFWATWCEPCRVEVPALVRTQDKYAANGVQIVGISLDSAVKVREFSKEFRIQYPLLIGNLDSIEITRKLGNKAAGLPYTVVLDAGGAIKARHLGGITEAQLDATIGPLLAKPQSSSR